MTNNIELQAELLAARPYTDVIFRDGTTTDGYLYIAETIELEGCVVQGETIEEAKENLRLFRIDYIQHLLEHNLPIPEPVAPAAQAMVFHINTHHANNKSDKPLLTIENDDIQYA